jgi:hypothetical protein
MSLRKLPSRSALLTAACASIVFLLNAIICRPLFRTEWVVHMFSIEAAYIALTRYVLDNFPDLTWFPLWNNGELFQSTYQPGLPLICAAVAHVLHVDAARGYHITIALFYCLGPVGMFFLAYRISGRRDIGMLAALLFSLFSPSAFIPVITKDMGGFLHARRFQALAYFGEGPNVSGLNIVPFALLALDAVYRRLTAWRFTLAAILLGLTVIVSWPASLVMACGVLAYLMSRDWPEARSRLVRLAVLAVAAYLLIAPLDLPSTIRDNQRNSQLIGGPYPYTRAHIFYFSGLALTLIASRVLLRRFHVPRLLEFGWYWFLIPGTVALTAFKFHIALWPQPERFHIGMELGIAMGAAAVMALALDRFGDYRISMLIVLAVLALVQTRTYTRYVRDVERPIDITSTYEWQASHWLDTHLHDQRVYLLGSIQFWINAWSDQPQVTGCCLPGLPNYMSWVVGYQVGSDDGAGSHGEEYAELWLRTWGAQAVVVNGPNTRDSYHGWVHPHKFDPYFPLVWQQGDDRIYRIPTLTTSLAHIIHANEVISRTPVNGVDVEPIRPYVRALTDPTRPAANFTWRNRHEAQISAANLPAKDLISIQETWSPGWHARAGGRPVEVRRDAMGFLLLAPHTGGDLLIDLSFDGGPEGRLFNLLSIATMLALLIWIGLSEFRRRAVRRHRGAPRPTPNAA